MRDYAEYPGYKVEWRERLAEIGDGFTCLKDPDELQIWHSRIKYEESNHILGKCKSFCILAYRGEDVDDLYRKTWDYLESVKDTMSKEWVRWATSIHTAQLFRSARDADQIKMPMYARRIFECGRITAHPGCIVNVLIAAIFLGYWAGYYDFDDDEGKDIFLYGVEKYRLALSLYDVRNIHQLWELSEATVIARACMAAANGESCFVHLPERVRKLLRLLEVEGV